MDEIKLKPCPFCGCTARLYFKFEPVKNPDWFTVVGKCGSCDAQSQEPWIVDISNLRNEKELLAIDRAAAWRWNRRAGDENE